MRPSLTLETVAHTFRPTGGAGRSREALTVTGATPRTVVRRQDAAEQLFTRYRDQLFRFCLARLRSREEAEDAVQNVFMRVHMALQRGVRPQFEAAWLYKIAHNVCLSRRQ